jgi:hypothetical protein
MVSFRYLVRPAAIIWPGNLASIALINSFHVKNEGDRYTTSRIKYFLIAALICTCYQFFPSFIFQILGSVSLLCYFAPKTPFWLMMGSGKRGLGFLSFSFDWSNMNLNSPITSPLWSVLNQYFGAWMFFWVITPIVWSNNLFGKDQQIGTAENTGPNGTNPSFPFPLGLAMNGPWLFDKFGNYVSGAMFVNRTTLDLNSDLYAAKEPIRLTTVFAIDYMQVIQSLFHFFFSF